jgi:hypothetical protein
MSLLWTLKSFVFRSGTMAESSQKVVVYIIYTQIMMAKEGMKPSVPCSVLKKATANKTELANIQFTKHNSRVYLDIDKR